MDPGLDSGEGVGEGLWWSDDPCLCADSVVEPASLEPSYPVDAPVSSQELEACTATLRKLARGRGFFDGDHCRELRRALAPLSQRMQRRMFGGLSQADYEEGKAQRREAVGRRAQRRALDQQCVEKAAMRSRRLERLAELQRQGEHLPLVADGAAQAAGDGDVQDEASAELREPRACYTCKRRFYLLHHFYADLCPECAALNWQKRHQACDCRGMVALVTGGRVKIGFQVVLKLLRWGARVAVTTRFPRDAAQRFAEQAKEEGADWMERLDVYGLDFRDVAAIEGFCAFCCERYDRLDVLINNACQTIRRPIGYYKHLLQAEASVDALPGTQRHMLEGFEQWHALHPQPAARAITAGDAEGGEGCRSLAPSAAQSQVALLAEDLTTAFPSEVFDTNGQQVDLRLRNTWIMKMEEIQTAELAEVFLINAMAPFILNSRLQPLLERAPEGSAKFIVNVSAMEGKFYRTKAPYHPHTNMAKAALNQLTRTAAGDLATRRIYMSAVDTGWINDENPLEKAKRYSERHNFQCPLDEVDAAARILDPVAVAMLGGEPLWDVFLKDYAPTEW